MSARNACEWAQWERYRVRAVSPSPSHSFRVRSSPVCVPLTKYLYMPPSHTITQVRRIPDDVIQPTFELDESTLPPNRLVHFSHKASIIVVFVVIWYAVYSRKKLKFRQTILEQHFLNELKLFSDHIFDIHWLQKVPQEYSKAGNTRPNIQKIPASNKTTSPLKTLRN